MNQDQAVSQKRSKPPKRMEIFRAANARELSQEVMPIEGVDAGVEAGFAKIMAGGTPPEAGAAGALLFREPGSQGLSLGVVRFKSGFVLPRHSHDCDCLYYVTAGVLKLGSATLRKGDGFFVPARQAYSYEAGPQGVEVLEFRNATEFNFEFKQNDEAHWDRVAAAICTHAKAWQTEPVPVQ
jgi:quercetin dioxygenase-like cupin family protein